MTSDAGERPTTHPSAHALATEAVRTALRDVEHDLVDHRRRRDQLNDEIRLLVEQQATLKVAVGTFERRAAAEAAAIRPRRAKPAETKS